MIELAGYGVQSFGQFGGYGGGKYVRPVGLCAVQPCEIQVTVKNIFCMGRHRRLTEQGVVKHLPALAIWGRDDSAFKYRWQIGIAIQQGGIAAGFRMNQHARRMVPGHKFVVQGKINQPFGYDAVFVSRTAVAETGFHFGKIGCHAASAGVPA